MVRPCVAFLHSYDEATGKTADPESALIPRLDAREVAAVFTAKFRDFLRKELEPNSGAESRNGAQKWYRGSWTTWHESNWRSMSYFVFSRSFWSLRYLSSLVIIYHRVGTISSQMVLFNFYSFFKAKTNPQFVFRQCTTSTFQSPKRTFQNLGLEEKTSKANFKKLQLQNLKNANNPVKYPTIKFGV